MKRLSSLVPHPSSLFVLALVLRLAYGLAQDPLAVYATGGDSRWYLLNGYALMMGFDNGLLSFPGLPGVNLPIALNGLPTPPLYLLFIGFWQAVLPSAAAIIAIRLVQATMGVATVYFAYRLARTLGGERAGLIAALALAVSPAFIIEPAAVLSETLYMFLISAALWLYVRMFVADEAGVRCAVPLQIGMVAALLGLATLTRAVLLLFPLGLAIHLLLVCGWKRGLRQAALLLAVFVGVISTWTIYNRVAWGRWVIAAPGLASFVYLGATGWEGPEQVDQNLTQDAGVEGELPSDPADQQSLYQDAALAVISSDPLGYLGRRFSDLADAYFQPHGTVYFGGESLKEMVANWLQSDHTLSGLLRLAQADWFWPKLVIYAFHYAGLVFGLAGLWLSRRQWRLALPLAGFIAYTTLVHFVLDALARYLFPTMVFWWVFAALALSTWYPRRAAAP